MAKQVTALLAFFFLASPVYGELITGNYTYESQSQNFKEFLIESGVSEIKAEFWSKNRNVYIKKDGDDVTITNSSPDSPLAFTISFVLGKEIEADWTGNSAKLTTNIKGENTLITTNADDPEFSITREFSEEGFTMTYKKGDASGRITYKRIKEDSS